MKPIEYHLNIYSPDSRTAVLIGWRSNSPFMQIGPNDVINCSGFEKNSTRMLKATRVEHLIWEAPDKIAHKALIFTTVAEGAAAAPSAAPAVVAVPVRESATAKAAKKK